jgi:hypothetical protein
VSGSGAGWFGRAPGRSGVDPAHGWCAHPVPDLAISSPGRIPDAQTAQVVAYLAVIGTPTTLTGPRTCLGAGRAAHVDGSKARCGCFDDREQP